MVVLGQKHILFIMVQIRLPVYQLQHLQQVYVRLHLYNFKLAIGLTIQQAQLIN